MRILVACEFSGRVVDVMSKECQYSKHRDDPRCAKCERNYKNEN